MKTSEFLLNEALEIKRELVRFLRHPLTEIKHVPDWSWQRLVLLQLTVTAVTGALAGLAEQRIIFAVISNFFFKPIITGMLLGISTLFFYYCFQIFAEKTVSVRKLATVILFANIPQFIFQVVDGLVPPVALVAMAFTALLLLVGFVENFELPRKLAIKMIAALYAIFFAVWIYNQASNMQMEKAWKMDNHQAPEVELGK